MTTIQIEFRIPNEWRGPMVSVLMWLQRELVKLGAATEWRIEPDTEETQ